MLSASVQGHDFRWRHGGIKCRPYDLAAMVSMYILKLADTRAGHQQ